MKHDSIKRDADERTDTDLTRRTLVKFAGVAGIATFGTVGFSNVTAQAQTFEFDGDAAGWMAQAPDDIAGETNPTLALEIGETYVVEWTNADGLPHDFVMLDENEEHVIGTEDTSEEGETLALEFEATEEMAEYYCSYHPQAMRGEIELVGDDGEMEEDTTEEPEEEEEPEDDGVPEEETEIKLPREYHAHLRGDPHDIETEATGEARFPVNEDGTQACFEVMVEGICNVTQAHIHLGAEGEDGPIVVWLYPEEGMEPELIEGRFSGTLAEGVITEDDFVGEWEDTDFEDIIPVFESEGAYVNVHTEDHPGGELRGQIVPPHE